MMSQIPGQIFRHTNTCMPSYSLQVFLAHQLQKNAQATTIFMIAFTKIQHTHLKVIYTAQAFLYLTKIHNHGVS